MDTVPHCAQDNNPHYILIPLRSGGFAMADFDDADLGDYLWWLNGPYAARRAEGKLVTMHRVILERKLQRPIHANLLADHINIHPLDNRRSNLREATPTQNLWNSSKQKNNTTHYIGVTKQGNNYIARIGGHKEVLGYFTTALDASFCYDKAALELRGEYARLNHPLEEVAAWQPPIHHLFSSNTSGYRGVTKLKHSNKWQASYRKSSTQLLHLGTFDTPQEAAKAYDRAAIKFAGKRAIFTNFNREEYEHG